MSDTKTLIKYVRDRLNDGPNITFGKPTVLDLVEALEQAEARVRELKSSLSSSISKQSEMADGIERVVKANHALADKAQKAEAENVRLTKELDWLADKLSDHCLADGGDCNIPICPTYIACRNATPKVWIEAASRAVAAGDVMKPSKAQLKALEAVAIFDDRLRFNIKRNLLGVGIFEDLAERGMISLIPIGNTQRMELTPEGRKALEEVQNGK